MSTEHPDHETTITGQTTINISEADIENTPASRRQARALVYAVVVLFVTAITIGAANLLFTSSQVHHVNKNSEGLKTAIALEQRQIRADCGFYRDLAALPVATPPAGGNPTITVPRIVSDARQSWVGHGCPGTLPPPDPSFVKWAGFYHLPVVRDRS